MALQRQVGERDLALGAELGQHLGHVGVDVLVAERARHRHAVVAVLHEVQLADPVDVDRAASTRRGAARRRPAPSARAPCPTWGGSCGRTRGRGRRCRRSSRARSPAGRAGARRARPSAATTSSNGRITFTSLGSPRSRSLSRASARARRLRAKSNWASDSGRPVSRGTPQVIPEARGILLAHEGLRRPRGSPGPPSSGSPPSTRSRSGASHCRRLPGS